MKVDIIISADYIRKDLIENKVVVVIDMLRATYFQLDLCINEWV